MHRRLAYQLPASTSATAFPRRRPDDACGQGEPEAARGNRVPDRHARGEAGPGRQINKAAQEAGIAEKTINRAKVMLKVESYQAGEGKNRQWFWQMAICASTWPSPRRM